MGLRVSNVGPRQRGRDYRLRFETKIHKSQPDVRGLDCTFNLLKVIPAGDHFMRSPEQPPSFSQSGYTSNKMGAYNRLNGGFFFAQDIRPKCSRIRRVRKIHSKINTQNFINF